MRGDSLRDLAVARSACPTCGAPPTHSCEGRPPGMPHAERWELVSDAYDLGYRDGYTLGARTYAQAMAQGVEM